MPNNYFPGLMLLKPQYDDTTASDKPENVTWWKGSLTGNITQAQAVAVQAAFDGAWADLWKDVGVTTASYIGSILTDWGSNTGITNTTVGTFTAVPGDATGELGNNTAALLSMQVALRFRGGHGRVYLPALGNSVLTDPSHLTTAAVTALDTAYASLVSSMNGVATADGGPYVQQVFRYRNAKVGDVHPAAILPVISGGAQALLASQRRRLRKVAHR